MNKARSPERTHRIHVYADADVIVTRSNDETLAQQSVDRQAELIAGFLCRSTPDRIVRKFCELTGADYEKIMALGVSAMHETDARKTRGVKRNRPHSKLDETKVREAKKMIASGKYSYAEIGRYFGVSSAIISAIARGVAWEWVKEEASSG